MSLPRKLKLAVVDVLGLVGFVAIVVVGGTESGPGGPATTVQVWVAGVRSTLSKGSMARTSKVCSPASSRLYETGLAHSCQFSTSGGSGGSGGSPGSGGSGGGGGGSGGASSRHSNRRAVGGAVLSVPVNVNTWGANVLAPLAGAVTIVALGAVRSGPLAGPLGEIVHTTPTHCSGSPLPPAVLPPPSTTNSPALMP